MSCLIWLLKVSTAYVFPLRSFAMAGAEIQRDLVARSLVYAGGFSLCTKVAKLRQILVEAWRCRAMRLFDGGVNVPQVSDLLVYLVTASDVPVSSQPFPS